LINYSFDVFGCLGEQRSQSADTSADISRADPVCASSFDHRASVAYIKHEILNRTETEFGREMVHINPVTPGLRFRLTPSVYMLKRMNALVGR
jgi:hypothetical protein